MPGLDNMEPEMGAEPVVGLQSGESDREGAMAKADLYKLANYAHKLFQQLNDEDQLEGWVQAKITKAADYIASVYHYLEYEMKFSEYGKALDDSDVLSESQKVALKNRLMEAKDKIKELKKTQAEKMKDKQVDEGALSGGERACTECGGSGMVYEEPKAIPGHVKGKVEKYNRQAKAMHAASKRLDRNHNGIPDDEEMEESFGDKAKSGDTFKTKTGVATKTSTGMVHKNTSYHDDGEAEDKSGKGKKSHAKAQSSSEKKDRAPAQKQSPKSAKTWGMKDSAKFDNRDKAMDEGAKPDFLDMDKDGDKKESMKKAVADKKGGPKKGVNPFAKKVEEAAKPSAGLSKAKKSEVVKDAKAGKDIGKPGKSFDKVAAKAGGGEKGKKIAAAAMWKNIKETTAYLEEKKKLADKDYDGDGKLETGKEEHAGSVDKAIKASKAKETVKESNDTQRIRELTGRLNLNENLIVKKSSEVDQLKSLTNLFKG